MVKYIYIPKLFVYTKTYFSFFFQLKNTWKVQIVKEQKLFRQMQFTKNAYIAYCYNFVKSGKNERTEKYHRVY